MSTKSATYYNFSKGGVPIRNTADYSPFGVQLDGRTISMDSYRYGFNNEESDDEIKGIGNSYDYGFRIYDPRVGRFLSIDPIARKFPELTPYQFASNTPIMASDLDGLEANIEIVPDNDGKPIISIVMYIQIENQSSYTQDKINSLTKGIIKHIEDSYKGTISYKGVELKVQTQVFITEGEKKFSFTFKDVGSDYKPEDGVLGKADIIGNTQVNNSNIYLGTEQDMQEQVSNTGAHEKGHEMGLRHTKKNRNLMNRHDDGSNKQAELTSRQLKQMVLLTLMQQDDINVKKLLKKEVKNLKKEIKSKKEGANDETN